MLTLYHYDHCPYCVKARMIFGIKNIPFQLKALLYDDEATPRSFIGAKMLPILKTEKAYMPESLDIVRYMDDNFQTPLVDWKEDSRLNEWLQSCGNAHYFLAMPRWVQASLEEFKTSDSKDYFQKKKEKHIGSFSEALKNTKNLIEKMEECLKELEILFQNKNKYWASQLSVNDFHLFAYLRMLSVVKDISFPEKVSFYMKNLSEESKVPLHHSIAR